MVRQLFKAMNGVDNVAQIWNKHFHHFMDHEGFVRTSRDNCIYTHSKLSVQSSLYVDDILASADPDKKYQLDLFVRKVQKQFSVRVLGEPTKFLGMEITYMREQGICCISQQTYIDKLVSVFLNDHDSNSVFFLLPLWRRVYTTSWCWLNKNPISEVLTEVLWGDCFFFLYAHG